MSFQEWNDNGELDLIRWTSEYGSVGDVVTQVADLNITGLLCNLNSVPVIEYILILFASVKKHITVADDSTSSLGNTNTSYSCSVWCAATNAIPAMLRVKVLLSHLTDSTQISLDGRCKWPLLGISIHTNAVMDGTLPVKAMVWIQMILNRLGPNWRLLFTSFILCSSWSIMLDQ